MDIKSSVDRYAMAIGIDCRAPRPKLASGILLVGLCERSRSETLLLGILNANRKIRKHTDTDVAFTREYSRVSIFHRERECTN